MPPLHEVLAAKRDEVLLRWTEGVRRERPDPSISGGELVDHVPRFVDEIVTILRDVDELKGEVDLKSEVAVLETSAAEHGNQRFRLGFDIETVVREYGLLHHCILQVASNNGVVVTLSEQRTLVEAISEGIVDAASQYTRQRDVELARRSGEHFAFVAHELRNPLGSAELAFSSLSKKGLLPDSPMTKLLGRGLRRTKELIENTLSLMLAGQMNDLRRTKVKLSDLLEDAMHEAEPAAADKHVTLSTDSKTEPVIDVDERLMRSALTNVVGNAVKFTRNGGTVHIHSFEDGGRAVVEVEDTCGGLPPDAAEKMFTPFVQVGEDRTGFGLGLAIARQALQAHGGNISVRDRPGVGCTFVVEVPTSIGS
jgi:signal transduction histidine kinase